MYFMCRYLWNIMYRAAGNLRLLPKTMKSLPFFPFHDLILSGGPCFGLSSWVRKLLRPKTVVQACAAIYTTIEIERCHEI